ncbi:hypothetical protein A2982_02935 [candidate division WWE3 bacterium RIFCSPLOWO2_01_FULL_39_13]|uniref:YgjP-like metallopeptidase domain-containing protein n=1 Tax=candidate division WWE3 bacterium RIFCSPLOWO2_01_FULL_39_13 TaxID=1802624 RepID=A0A1F4V2X3_UNCKA|nr:MAG: hypothetical protein A2982_02935 [candidate division WWE3 bacterium RIFCSPLOWO2_01_FULL_39_13]
MLSRNDKPNREYARRIIENAVEALAGVHGLSYNRIAVRNQKTRLGSCSSKKNLNFNWQIVKFPEEHMKYVIKHELAHLVHQNHSKHFWDYVMMLDPDFKIHRRWIKENYRKFIK